jgi:glycosyltransferase involved in cell wall biosynthesis
VSADAQTAPDVSIVIPCYNGMATIARCLDSVRQAIDGRHGEIILVDSSDDGTDRFVAATYPDVRLTHFPTKTLPGKARNHGVALARARLIAFIDADCVAPTTLIDNVLASFHRHPEQSAIVGCIRNANPGAVSWLSFISEFNGFFGRQERRPILSLPSYCAVYRRSVFDGYHGFPETLWPGEDTVLCARLAEGKEPLFLEPRVWVYHHNRDTMTAYLSHQYALGYGFSVSRKLLPALPGADSLHGSAVFIYPMAAYRCLKMLQRTFDSDWQNGFRILWLMPGYLWGMSQWIKGVRQGRKDHFGA